MLGTYVLSAGYYEAYYLQAQKVRTKLIEDFKKVFKSVDVLMTPVSPFLPFKIGEKVEDLQIFNPTSMADRILGMGDVINLVKKAEEQFSEEENEKLEKKFRKASFTYEDYLKQMSAIKKMGPLKGLLKMMPGMADMGDLDDSEKEFTTTEAIILAMTPGERQGKDELIPSRKNRIAKGSGNDLAEVNRLVKGFKQLKKFAQQMPKFKKSMKKSEEFKKFSNFI